QLFSSDNRVAGIVVQSFPAIGIFISGGQNNWIFGTYVGTDPTGTVARGNGGTAIRVTSGARFNLIGTNGDRVDDAAERNVVSGNAESGIGIDGVGTNQNIVAGNYVGTDATGTAALGNGTGVSVGIAISSGASFNRIGTNSDGIADAAERNLIS